MHIYDNMSLGRPVVMSPTSPAQGEGGREVIEYHGGINSITILGEALGQQRHNRLVKVIIREDFPGMNAQNLPPDLDAIDVEYLTKKGALGLPPRQCW